MKPTVRRAFQSFIFDPLKFCLICFLQNYRHTFSIYSHSCHQAKLRNAAKSAINRWVKPHPKNPKMTAPEWVQKEWREGCKNELADLLSQCNFQKDRHMHVFWIIKCFVDYTIVCVSSHKSQEEFMNKLIITVKKQQKFKLVLDEGWYSKTELVDLKWTTSGSLFHSTYTGVHWKSVFD